MFTSSSEAAPAMSNTLRRPSLSCSMSCLNLSPASARMWPGLKGEATRRTTGSGAPAAAAGFPGTRAAAASNPNTNHRLLWIFIYISLECL